MVVVHILLSNIIQIWTSDEGNMEFTSVNIVAEDP